MCQPSYDLLMDEVKCINSAWGYTGVLDALMYIQDHAEDYEDTKVYSQFRRFMAEGRRLFAPVEH